MAWYILSHPKLWHVAFQVAHLAAIEIPPPKKPEGGFGPPFFKKLRIPHTHTSYYA